MFDTSLKLLIALCICRVLGLQVHASLAMLVYPWSPLELVSRSLGFVFTLTSGDTGLM